MSASGSPHDDDEREPGWPGADEATVELSCARIARQMVRSRARTVGLLPFAGKETARGKAAARPAAAREVNFYPLLERLSSAIFAFDGGTVAFIGPWTEWGGPVPGGGAARSGSRQVAPGVVEILPPSAAGPRAAAEALAQMLATPPADITRVLVNIGELAPPGRVPEVASAFDKIVAVVVVRRVRKAWVSELLAELPEDKRLGAILVG
jgi:hypothetical protein